MDFPFETKTKDGRKATVLGALPNGRLVGFITYPNGAFASREWNADGSFDYPSSASITLPLQIKPLTTYRMRGGGIAWTTGLVKDGRIQGLTADGDKWSWLVNDGAFDSARESKFDLIEELPPGTTE